MVTGKRQLPRFSGEWKTKRIGEILRVGHGQSQRAVENPYGRYPIFATGGKIGQASSFVYDKPSVLIGRKGTIDKPQYVDIPFWTIDTLFYTIIRDGYSEKFIYYCFCLIDWVRYNEASGVPSLNAKTIENIAIKVPKKSEQTAIAEVLSDADSLIASLQKFIAKKKAIKQGAMQELLTGKRRLPGFSGEWIKITIGDEQYALIDQNTLPSRTQPGYTFEYITLENVEKGRLLKTIPCKYGTSPSRARRIVKKNDILFGTVRPNLHSHLFIRHECADVVCSTGFCVITCFHNVLDPAFLYFKFYTKEVDSQVEAIISGSNYPALSSSDLKSLKIVIPSNLEEQIAIAQVLSDMDAEIEKLEKKLSQYQKIKQGMMQELLTGKIRLIDAAPKQEQQVIIAAKKHNQQFDDAVMIAGIVNAFYSETFPLGRKKVQKLLYLMRRKEKADVSVFHKKAAGPYADSVRYNGGETIAEKRNYIAAQTNGKGTLFSRGAKIGKALGYIQSWGKQANIDWLTSNFQYTRVDDLELFATVDMAICDLRKVHKPIAVQTIKEFIQSTKEWRKKLDKSYFSDPNIQRAINKCREFFGEE